MGSAGRSCQVMALTSERLLFFNAEAWTLVQVVILMDIVEVVLTPYCDTLILLRTTRAPDVIVDIRDRSRFLDELQLAVASVSRRWGGAELGEESLKLHVFSDA